MWKWAQDWSRPFSASKLLFPCAIGTLQGSLTMKLTPTSRFLALGYAAVLFLKRMPSLDREVVKRCLYGQTILTRGSLYPGWQQSWAKTLGLASKAQARFQLHLSPLAMALMWDSLYNAMRQPWVLAPDSGPSPLLLLAEGRRAPGPSWGNKDIRTPFLQQCFPPVCPLPPFSGFPWWRSGKRWERKTNIYWSLSIYVPITFHGAFKHYVALYDTFLAGETTEAQRSETHLLRPPSKEEELD